MELAKNLRIDSVSRLNPTASLQISPSSSVAEAVALMRNHKVGCILVCVAEEVVGIFTERDLMRRVLAANVPFSLPVSQFMTANPVMVHPKDSIRCAIRRMEEGGYRHLPVVNDRGRPVGILSAKRIVHYLAEHYPATVHNLPPDPGVVPQEREGA